ncbi:programmed cell death protein,putative [Babesia bigemina]|uniref:Programmed cell death protein,putative n=1 Tax=Babesia bigemina TaxID=5866 RepID=A0A061D5L1_BABBI|nr:programmed cell death protein,putative [Babesia bigemina]CDR95828.1 programmed cell death protein,putative [Babesia bigemina]|eukprot:XP_012768014.1 programmed cell death protein,putative [Babesia bigemina]
MEAEEDFPRSSEVVLQPLGEPRRRSRAAAQQAQAPSLFARPQPKRSAKLADQRGRLPTLESLEAGSLVLGSVAVVAPTGLRIHLPGGLSGFVRSSDVVDGAQAAKSRPDHVTQGSFSVGSHVVCSVLEVKNGFAYLSMRPSVINKGLSLATITPGMLLPASLVAHEDHGILLSFNLAGADDVRGFAKYDDEQTAGTPAAASEDVDADDDAKDAAAEDAKSGKGVEASGGKQAAKTNGGKQAAKKGRSFDSLRSLPLGSTVYVVVDSVNVARKLVSCKWPWQCDVPVSTDCQLPILCVRPGLLLVGEISDIHYPASALSGNAEFKVNYGFDVKCLNGLTATVPAVHSVVSYSPRRPEDNTDDGEMESDDEKEADVDASTADGKSKVKRKSKTYALPGAESDSPLGLEDHVVGRVLYVNHWQKTVYVSLLSDIVNWKGPKGHPHQLIYSGRKTYGKVLRSIPGHGVVFALCRVRNDGQLARKGGPEALNYTYGDLGYCDPSNLCDEGKDDSDKSMGAKGTSAPQIALAFSSGSVHAAAELEFDYLTRFVRVSMRESLLTETALSPFQLRGGTSVKGVITKVSNSGVSVRLSKLVHGKVQLEHLTDVPLPHVPDNMVVGGTLKLRVLRYDHVHSVLLLTAKRSMRKDPAPLTSFQQTAVGKEFLGYIWRVKRTGEKDSKAKDKVDETVYVRFYNELQTTLDQSELREAELQGLDMSHGALVRAVVTRADARRRAFYVTVRHDKMASLKALARARSKRQREIRRAECKKVFTNYVSSRKRRKAEA